MKQVIELLEEKLNESKNRIARITDIFYTYGVTDKTEHLIDDKKELEQFVDALQRALNILSDSSAKICTELTDAQKN